MEKPKITHWNKKAQSVGADAEAGELGSESVHYMFYFGMVFIVTFILFLSARAYMASDLYINPVAENEIYAERVFNCFAQYDSETGRHGLILDEAVMTEVRLGQCFKDSKRSAYVVLEDENHNNVKDLVLANGPLPSKLSSYPVVYVDEQGTMHKGTMMVGVTTG